MISPIKSNFSKVLYSLAILLLLAGVGFGSVANAGCRKESGKSQGWLGVVVRDVNERVAKKLKLESTDGAYVKEVKDNSPADSAGIEEGDVIIEFGGKKVLEADDLARFVKQTQPGEKVKMVIIRDGKKKTVEVSVGERPRRSWFSGVVPRIPRFEFRTSHFLLGIKVITLNEQLADFFEVPNKEGVLVEEVEKGSVADKAGFKAGDVIVKIGDKSVDCVEKLRKEVYRHYRDGGKVEFEVIRKGARKDLVLELNDVEDYKEEGFYFRLPHLEFFKIQPLRIEIDEWKDFDIGLEFEGLDDNFGECKKEIEKEVIQEDKIFGL